MQFGCLKNGSSWRNKKDFIYLIPHTLFCYNYIHQVFRCVSLSYEPFLLMNAVIAILALLIFPSLNFDPWQALQCHDMDVHNTNWMCGNAECHQRSFINTLNCLISFINTYSGFFVQSHRTLWAHIYQLDTFFSIIYS